MSEIKHLVCLTNSRKLSGRCIAGKELLDNKTCGAWIRPVSHRLMGEILEHERRFKNGHYPQVLDILAIPLLQYHPNGYQQENYLITEQARWEKIGRFNVNQLASIVDTVPDTLWSNGYSSYHGINDRIPEEIAVTLNNSLVLIQPTLLKIVVSTEGIELVNDKKKVRAFFIFNQCQYKLTVTDPNIEAIYLKKQEGEYTLDANAVYLCISIGEPFHGFCYKLVATIINGA